MIGRVSIRPGDEERVSARPCVKEVVMNEWMDVSAPIFSGMTVWPGDPEVQVTQVLSMSRRDPCNVSAVSMGVHAGTHVDAPRHYVEGGIDIAHVPVDALCGPARVIGVRGVRAISSDDLRHYCPERGERLLLKTDNSETEWWNSPRDPGFCHLTPDAAEYLVKIGVRTIGIDGMSIGPEGKQGDIVHRILLPGDVTVIEGLALNDVPWCRCELICLPIRIAGCDGAPARALVRPL